MNSYQRVMGTLSGQPVDKLPVFAVLGAYGGKLTHTDLRTLFSDASAYVAGQQALQREFGFDLVMTPFVYTAISEAFGGETAWSDTQAPNMKRPGVRTAEEVLSAPLPDPQKSGLLPVVLDATRRLAGLYKEQVPIIGVLPGPAVMPSLIIGMEQWLETVLFDEVLARKLLDHTAPFFVSWANALLDAGADCLVITEGMAAAEIAPRALFSERFLPCITASFAQINGPKVLHHTGGCINHILDLLPGLPGLVGVAVGSRDDLAEARRLIGPDVTLIGNLDNLSFPSASADKMSELSRSCLQTAAPSGHYILANSGADIPLTTPPENLRAMLAAAAAYSKERGSIV
ncbi:MAG: uroporphyrinogen decarboxylase family protein [Desulfuromonadaceae bacterium]|nr:uroporphyrinogen decarboxylase family protein [Desulfuromonadaceae bacterium]